MVSDPQRLAIPFPPRMVASKQSADDVQDARLVDHLLTWLDSQHGTPF